MEGRHTAESVLDLARGFMESRVVLTGAELNVFTVLSTESLTAEEASLRCGADRRAVTILLDALSAIGLLEKGDGRYRTESCLVPFLSSGSPQSVLPMLLHTARLWRTWSRITDIVLGKESPKLGEGAARDRTGMEDFIGAMHVVGMRTAPKVVAAIDPAGASRLLDVGGGSGTYTIAFLQADSRMKATLLDLPPVLGLARQRIEAAGLADRVALVAGDFYKDELPSGNDLALISAIIHQNSHAQNRVLYGKVYRALEPGGRVVIRDFVMDPDRTRPVEGALFAVNMLAGTPGGGTWTFGEIEEGLKTAGFTDIRLLQSKGMFSLVEGFRPKEG